jgi:hypothetical protein
MAFQGWTKFSEFADMNALSDEDWDKVPSRIRPKPSGF